MTFNHPLTPNTPAMRPTTMRFAAPRMSAPARFDVSYCNSLLPMPDTGIRPKYYYRSGCCRIILEQSRDSLGGLRAVGNPVTDTGCINIQALFLACGNRIEKPEALDGPSIAFFAAVGHYNIVKGPFLGAHAG